LCGSGRKGRDGDLQLVFVLRVCGRCVPCETFGQDAVETLVEVLEIRDLQIVLFLFEVLGIREARDPVAH
jgi:hypothetical protein